MESMERVLALQSLEMNDIPVGGGAADSNASAGCSTQSSGTGKSSCSIQCGDAEALDW
jgi:hypothetical protein